METSPLMWLDWFLYDRDLCNERVKIQNPLTIFSKTTFIDIWKGPKDTRSNPPEVF